MIGKKIFFVIILSFLSCTFLFSNVLDKIQVENAIKDQIKENLSLVLAQDQYLVFVSSDIKKDRIRELDLVEEDNYTRKSSPPIDIPNNIDEDDYLPGFGLTENRGPVYNYQNPVDVEKEYKKEKYSYIDDFKLRNVRIVVVLDKDIPQPKTQQIISTLREKVRASYGANSTISFKSASLIKSKNIMDRLRENPVLALLLVLIIFLIGLVLLLFLILLWYVFFSLLGNLLGGIFGRKKAPPTAPRSKPLSPRGTSQAAPKEKLSDSTSAEESPPTTGPSEVTPNALLKERLFVNKFTSHPLISRKFFLELPKEEREMLYNAFGSTTVHNLLEKLDPPLKKLRGINKESDEEGSGDGDELIIDKYSSDLEHFKKITISKMDDEFGSLSLLTKEELDAILRGMPTEDLVVMLKNVDRDIANYYISQLNEEKRKDLLAQLNTEIADLPGEKIIDLKDKVRRSIQYIGKNVFIDNPDKEELSKILIESSTDAKSMVTNIQQSDEELYEKLKHFAYDEKDLMNEEENYVTRVLEDIETEDIAKATFIMDDNFKSRVMDMLSEERKEFVQSIIDANRNTISKEEARSSLNKMLAVYREKKSREIT